MSRTLSGLVSGTAKMRSSNSTWEIIRSTSIRTSIASGADLTDRDHHRLREYRDKCRRAYSELNHSVRRLLVLLFRLSPVLCFYEVPDHVSDACLYFAHVAHSGKRTDTRDVTFVDRKCLQSHC